MCQLCGKVFPDEEGLSGEKRLMRHISAVHGTYAEYLKALEVG